MTWWKFWEKGKNGSAPDYYEEGVDLMRNELYHDALTSFRLALRDRAEDAATLEQMAVAFTHIGQVDQAVRAYRQALELRPASTSAHYGISFLLLKAGREVEAAQHLRAFLDRARPDREDERHIRHAQRTLARLGAQTTADPSK